MVVGNVKSNDDLNKYERYELSILKGQLKVKT